MTKLVIAQVAWNTQTSIYQVHEKTARAGTDLLPGYPARCVPPAFPQESGADHLASHPSLRQPLLDSLSTRELEVLHLLAGGASNQEIAETLVITLDTNAT
jgi:DNA-binding NarL/FixJ family response regulator